MVILVLLDPTGAIFMGMPGADRRRPQSVPADWPRWLLAAHGQKPLPGHHAEQIHTMTGSEESQTHDSVQINSHLSQPAPPCTRRAPGTALSLAVTKRQPGWSLHSQCSGHSSLNSVGGNNAFGQDSQRRLTPVCQAEGEAG